MTLSASRAGSDPASASETVSTVSMPSRRQVRITRDGDLPPVGDQHPPQHPLSAHAAASRTG